MSVTYTGQYLHTNTCGQVPRWVGVAAVTQAAEGVVCVLAEAVVPTDVLVVTFINICRGREHREEVSTRLIFTASICKTDSL